MDYFTTDELSTSPDFIEKHKALLVEIDYEEDEDGEKLKMNVLYCKKKGCQRKGMSSKFYEDFENNRPYLDLQSVKKAYEYLQADHISTLKELQQNFNKNFVENFVEGESIFWACW